MNVSFHKFPTGDIRLTVYTCYGKSCWTKEQTFQVRTTISKDYLGNGNRYRQINYLLLSFQKCATGDIRLTVYSYYGKGCQTKEKKFEGIDSII